MLQIKNITKQYKTGDLIQDALKGVSLNFRENEFVSILGPSGSGKTTLLNIIGGLDRYDSGDLVINHISTKQYTDKDWDSYRNHTIGFVFQSYNLIGHQSVLSNVELALTISGISKRERKKRAIEALEQVGLKDHIHKRPNQLSGGQMQRVAIARALVNDPDILLADEPTGALDSETSVSVMELLKEVANDRLVIMVTHNPELGERYATRTVKLKDGVILEDSNPFVLEEEEAEDVHKKMGKASMSFLTSLSLSFNNLRTKKGRTILTAFAGSIGIIGIALIISFSNGISNYIDDIQRETMTSYPIKIDAEAIDMNKMMGNVEKQQTEKVETDKKAVYSDSLSLIQENRVINSMAENNLTAFKKYLEDHNQELSNYLGENGIIYSYEVPFSAFGINSEGKPVSLRESKDEEEDTKNQSAVESMQMGMMKQMTTMMGRASDSYFTELIPGKDGALISQVTKDSYDMVAGTWPKAYNEVLLVLDENHQVPTTVLYAMNLISEKDYNHLITESKKEEEFIPEQFEFPYEEMIGKEFYILAASDSYVEENGRFQWIDYKKMDAETIKDHAEPIKIVGVICPNIENKLEMIKAPIGYTRELTTYLIDRAKNSEIVKEQQKNQDVNILTGVEFAPKTDKEKAAIAKAYLSNMGISQKAEFMRQMSMMSGQMDAEQTKKMANMNEVQLAQVLDSYLKDMDEEMLLMFYENSISTGTYEENMDAFGYINEEAPTSISIYPGVFEDKEKLSNMITDYNEQATKENQVVYTDMVAMMTSSMMTIIDVVSYVLIAFVGVSLVVSSIMIGIITYISVLERTKEIGVLRAIGASKHNISQVFNAETFIIGLLSGAIGIGVSEILLIPTNKILAVLIEDGIVRASLPLSAAVILIVLSVILTMLGGIIPSRKAAKKDPVAALRSE